MIVQTDEIRVAIDKMPLNKACGLDQLSAEHLKYANQRLHVLLTFTVFYRVFETWYFT